MSPLSAARAALRVYAVGMAVMMAQLLRRCLGGFTEPGQRPGGEGVAARSGGTSGERRPRGRHRAGAWSGPRVTLTPGRARGGGAGPSARARLGVVRPGGLSKPRARALGAQGSSPADAPTAGCKAWTPRTRPRAAVVRLDRAPPPPLEPGRGARPGSRGLQAGWRARGPAAGVAQGWEGDRFGSGATLGAKEPSVLATHVGQGALTGVGGAGDLHPELVPVPLILGLKTLKSCQRVGWASSYSPGQGVASVGRVQFDFRGAVRFLSKIYIYFIFNSFIA